MSEEESSNKEIIKLMRLTSQEQMILSYMEQFYNDKNSDKLYKLLRGRTSIRLIDYFVTNYSKKNRSNIIISSEKKETQNKHDFKGSSKNIEMVAKQPKGNNQIFNIHSSYKSQLKAWNKKYFDPFSRGDRIPFFLKDKCIITTIGQLNFFKWFITNKIYRFIKENYEDIEKNMNSNKHQNKKSKKVSNNKFYYRNKIKNSTYPYPKKSIISNEISTDKVHNCMENNCNKRTTKIEVRFD